MVMIRSVIGLARALVNDDPFGAAMFPGRLRVHVVFSITAARKGVLAILKGSPSHISRQWVAMPGFKSF